MKDRSDIDRLKDINRAIQKIEKYTENLFLEEFENNEMVQDAVFKNFEVIGEAAYKVTRKTKAEHQEIEWRKIEALRHKLVHDYYEIDMVIVWNTKEKKLPELFDLVIDLIEKLEADEKSL